MKITLSSGKVLELNQQQIHQVKQMINNQTIQKMQKYFKQMWNKAHTNLQLISDQQIYNQKDLKDGLYKVIKHGSYKDAADMVIQAIQYKVSEMILAAGK